MSNVEENYAEEYNHHSQISYSQMLIQFEYEPRQDFENQYINQIQVKKRK